MIFDIAYVFLNYMSLVLEVQSGISFGILNFSSVFLPAFLISFLGLLQGLGKNSGFNKEKKGLITKLNVKILFVPIAVICIFAVLYLSGSTFALKREIRFWLTHDFSMLTVTEVRDMLSDKLGYRYTTSFDEDMDKNFGCYMIGIFPYNYDSKTLESDVLTKIQISIYSRNQNKLTDLQYTYLTKILENVKDKNPKGTENYKFIFNK